MRYEEVRIHEGFEQKRLKKTMCIMECYYAPFIVLFPAVCMRVSLTDQNSMKELIQKLSVVAVGIEGTCQISHFNFNGHQAVQSKI